MARRRPSSHGRPACTRAGGLGHAGEDTARRRPRPSPCSPVSNRPGLSLASIPPARPGLSPDRRTMARPRRRPARPPMYPPGRPCLASLEDGPGAWRARRRRPVPGAARIGPGRGRGLSLAFPRPARPVIRPASVYLAGAAPSLSAGPSLAFTARISAPGDGLEDGPESGGIYATKPQFRPPIGAGRPKSLNSARCRIMSLMPNFAVWRASMRRKALPDKANSGRLVPGPSRASPARAVTRLRGTG